MPKIGHFVSFGIGGADRATIELIKVLSRHYKDIHICFSDMSFPIRTDDQDPLQPLLNIFEEYSQFANLHKISNVFEFLKLNLDILHTHRSGDDEWLIPGLGELDREFKIVETNFHGLENTPADFRIFPSKELARSRGKEGNPNYSIIANVVNSHPGQSLRHELGIPENVVIFGRVGRSDKSIYSPLLLEQYSKIENSATTLLWVGASVQALNDAKKLGVRNIVWLDPVRDPVYMANLYATFDVYCHANPLGETFGNTVAEALLRGIPVASLKGSRKYPQAQKELLDETQFCTKSRSYRALLKKYRDDPQLRRSVGVRNFAFAKQNLDSDAIAEKVIKVYEKILK